MPRTELAPDVRARVRSERSPEAQIPAAPARPPAGRRRQVQRFGSTRVGSPHQWLLPPLALVLAVAALVVAALLLLG
jgi:hypothetical protein